MKTENQALPSICVQRVDLKPFGGDQGSVFMEPRQAREPGSGESPNSPDTMPTMDGKNNISSVTPESDSLFLSSSPSNNSDSIESNDTQNQISPMRSMLESMDVDDLAPRRPPSSQGSGESQEITNEDRVPRINSHGRVKIIKCKQCAYQTLTKVDYWQHIETHIRPERRLKCHLCEFVTEYKHHMEYHINNHSGAKPFACEKCNYKCNSKSMLISHEKSHSSIYPYRCKDCTYATKYMHSLKTHLRKYRHEPGPVLNPDGTVSQHSIVDVYGTRRGPRAANRQRMQQSVPPPPPPPPAINMPTQQPNLFELMMMQASSFGLAAYPLLGMPPQLLLSQLANTLQNNVEQKDATTWQRPEMVPLDLSKPGGDESFNNSRVSLSSESSEEEDTNTPSQLQQNDNRTTIENNNNNNNSFTGTCEYCDISFGDVDLYKMHMSYHAVNGKPFACSRCGAQCKDKVSFFLHMTTTPHN